MVSICIPIFHSKSFLKETLNSISLQTYKSIEVILVNDGDNEDYQETLKAFNNLNITYVRQKNQGAGAARNKAYRLSTGRYIKFMDADDLLSPDSIESQLQLIKGNPGKIVSGKWGRFHNNELSTFTFSKESVWKNCSGKQWIIESWLQGPNMTQPGIFMIPTEMIEKYGLWKENLSKGPCDDMEFFTRMILNSDGIIFCPEAVLYYRSGNKNNLSGLKSPESFQWFLETIKLSAQVLLEKFPSNIQAKQAAATQFTILGYKSFPYHKNISRQAFQLAIELGGSNYPYPAGGITKILNQLLGWKTTLLIKKTLGYKKFN